MSARTHLARRKQPVRRHRLSLSLQVERLQRFDLDGVTHQLECRLAEKHLTRLSGLLQSGGNVNHIPRREALLGTGNDLSCHDANASLDPEVGQSLAHLDSRPAGAEGVVLVRERDAEDRHHRVADELLHRAAVAPDDLVHPLEVARKQRPQRLRIRRLPQGRRAHHIAEEHAHDLALLSTAWRRRCPALWAELEPLTGFIATNGTSRH